MTHTRMTYDRAYRYGKLHGLESKPHLNPFCSTTEARFHDAYTHGHAQGSNDRITHDIRINTTGKA